jgi:hypothetical protein
MRERRSSFESWREATLDATADYVEALYGLSSPYWPRKQSDDAASRDRRASDPNSHRGFPEDTRTRLPNLQAGAYWEHVTRWSLAHIMLPLRVLQGVHESPDGPRRRKPPSVVVSADGLRMQLTQGMQSKRAPFRVTNRGPRRHIDFDLLRFAASDRSLEKGIAVSLSGGPAKACNLYSDWEKRIASIEFNAGESKELTLEISARAKITLPRSVRGALRMRPEREAPVYFPIELELG